MANIKVSELPTTNTINNEDYLMIVQSNENKKITKETFKNGINADVLWSGDKVPIALNTDASIDIVESKYRPYNYTMCYAIFSIDGTRYALPFKHNGYGATVVYSGFWGINSGTNAYLTLKYGGYGSVSFQVKEINGKNLEQVHLYEIIGTK